MIKLIVGLGNPGEKYRNTRHNVGFMALEAFLKENHLSWKNIEKDQRYLLSNIDGHRFIALEPLTYMNESGRSVKYICDKYEIQPQDILVIHDDMDLSNGKIRVKIGRSAGGHNGIKDIMRLLNDNSFVHLKIGTDHPQNESVINWVLSRFSSTQLPEIEQAIQISSDIILDFIKGQTASDLMNKYNSNEN